MRKNYLFIYLFIFIVSGCIHCEKDYAPSVVESFIREGDMGHYHSVVTVRDGNRLSDYVAEINYPSQADTLLPEIYATEFALQSEQVLPCKFEGFRQQGEILVFQYRVDYVFRFQEFKVVVPFIVEKSRLEYGELVSDMPSYEFSFEAGEMVFSDLPDETIGGDEYYSSLVSCTAKMIIGPQTIYSTVRQKVLTKKEEVYFAPGVDDYDDLDVGVSM